MKEDIIVLTDHIYKLVRKRNLLNKDYLEKKSKKIKKQIDELDKNIGECTIELSNMSKTSIETLNRKFMVPKIAREYQIPEGKKKVYEMIGI